MLEGQCFDVINSADEDMPEPRFNKFSEAGVVTRSQNFMLHPIFSADGELIACI